MKRLLITLFATLTALASIGQSNATYNNLDVRGTSKFRGLMYGYGVPSVTLDPNNFEVVFVDPTDAFKFISTTWDEFVDSLATESTLSLWYMDGSDIRNKTADAVHIDTALLLSHLRPETKVGYVLTYLPQTDNVYYHSISTLRDTLIGAGISYWTFVDSATDTLYNNVADGDSPGVVAIKGNLELETTNTTATEGVVKQNGTVLMHTYHEKSNSNLFVGQGAGNFTADSSFNIGIGKTSLTALTTGFRNISIGFESLKLNTNGWSNISIGYQSMMNNIGGDVNVAIGGGLASNTEGDGNVAIGSSAMYNNKTGTYNVAIGTSSMLGTSEATNKVDYNVAVGGSALNGIRNGAQYNTAIGYTSLFSNAANDGSTAVGYGSMYYADSRTSGRTTYNTAVGYETLRGSSTAANNTGQYNTGVGYQALDGMTTASFNTVYGYDAGGGLTTGDSNILIGTSAGAQLTTESDRLFIDNTNTTTPLIWGNFRTDSIVFNGDITYGDTYWRDATVSGYTLAGGVQAPSLQTFKNSIKANAFNYQTANDIAYGQVQFNHDYKLGTDIEAHVHWGIDQAPAGGNDTIAVAFEYSWADIDEAFPTSTADTILIVVNGKTELTHYLSELAGTITGSGGDGLSSILLFRIERLQDYSKDTYPSWWFLFDVDFHFQIDSPGSDAELIK